jgi:hypothetical protein
MAATRFARSAALAIADESINGAISAGSKYSSIRSIRPAVPTLITMQTRMEIDWPAWPVACRMCCRTNPLSKSRRSRIS